jgi:hypothetical protein
MSWLTRAILTASCNKARGPAQQVLAARDAVLPAAKPTPTPNNKNNNGT